MEAAHVAAVFAGRLLGLIWVGLAPTERASFDALSSWSVFR
jgi:hypothetical protein